MELAPENLEARNVRSLLRLATADYAGAIADLDVARTIAPDGPNASNSLAWILATCPLAELRDPAKAYDLALALNENSGYQESGYLDTLAAACAALGRYEQASKWQQKVIGLVPPDERPQYQRRLNLYNSGQPYLDDPI